MVFSFNNHFLCRLALLSRYLAFCLADPEPWAPVMYCFFLALVFTFPLPSESFFSPPRLKEMPFSKML